MHLISTMSITPKLRAGILIVSETASQDPLTDKCGPVLHKVFEDEGDDKWEVAVVRIVPDNVLEIQRMVTRWSDTDDGALNLIVTSGGTGFALKDHTPEVRCCCEISVVEILAYMLQAVAPLLHRHASGLV